MLAVLAIARHLLVWGLRTWPSLHGVSVEVVVAALAGVAQRPVSLLRTCPAGQGLCAVNMFAALGVGVYVPCQVVSNNAQAASSGGSAGYIMACSSSVGESNHAVPPAAFCRLKAVWLAKNARHH